MSHHYSHDDATALQPHPPWTQAQPRQRADPCADQCTPRCPACGGLQCLCRPRFFPGQLLTDEDLNRLEQYVIDKNRLHNRYLHGWGVACGLELACDPCAAGHVLVRTGYALSPCGDDIIVCKEQSVDICALINACAPAPEPVCDPPNDMPPRDCSGKARRWVLAICYDERPVRGITAQLGMGDSRCGTRCACGGSASCGGCAGCAGGAASAGAAGDCACGPDPAAAPPPRHKPYAPQCEPTQVCEGYRFIAYPAPKEARRPGGDRPQSGDVMWTWLYANRARFGPLLERVLCCITRAMELRGAIREGRALDAVAALDVYTGYAGALQEFAADFSLHRCAFVARVQRLYEDARNWAREVGRPPTLTPSQVSHLQAQVAALDLTWFDIVSECFCSALLPACPPPAPDNCVPLGVVTIGGETCRVASICNWQARKLLISWRTIGYWLSWMPWGRLRQWIAGLCCGDQREQGAYRLLMLMFGVIFAGEPGALGREASTGAATVPGADPLAGALAADDMLRFMLQDFDALRRAGAASKQHPAWAALLARAADASALAPLAGGPMAAAGDTARRLSELEQTVADLKARLGEP